ncbi:MAG TPA: 4Fe-4S dicluster domain-containing protein, partial [Magnetospirillaceae bacterium]|nr:4Fe-4S dicluster domain-containing protein [Magnetospirillaceae bacterium]
MSESKDQEEGLLGSPSSRRDFLRIAGTGIAGAFVTLTLGCATMVRTQDGKNLKVWPTASGAMVQEPNLCVGCRRCETACTVRNDGKASAYLSRIKIARNMNFGPDGVTSAYAVADGQHGNFRIVAQTCYQCAQPICGDACPVRAIRADRKTGARVVNARRCVGCGACQDACPWKAATLDPETRIATK